MSVASGLIAVLQEIDSGKMNIALTQEAECTMLQCTAPHYTGGGANLHGIVTPIHALQCRDCQRVNTSTSPRHSGTACSASRDLGHTCCDAIVVFTEVLQYLSVARVW